MKRARRSSCAIATIRKAHGCRSSSTRRPTASLRIPLAPVHHRARRLALDTATTNARRLNLTRRGFLVSACGAATALLAMNTAYAASGRRGGYYQLPAAAAGDMQGARAELDRGEFVFDVQGHFRSPTG